MTVCEVETISVPEAMKILEESGMKLTSEQAAILLEFMTQLSRIAYEVFFLETPVE